MSNPLAKLNIKKQKYVKAIANGAPTKREAVIAAGYSASTARNPGQIETADVKAAFAELVRQRIKPSRIIQKVSEGMDAMETQFFSKDGLVIDSRDVIAWGERRRYTEIAAQFGGYYSPKQELEVTQKIDETTARRLSDIAEKLGVIDLEYEERKELRRSHVVLEAAPSPSSEQQSTEDDEPSGENNQ